jgi:hypothetical protein
MRTSNPTNQLAAKMNPDRMKADGCKTIICSAVVQKAEIAS